MGNGHKLMYYIFKCNIKGTVFCTKNIYDLQHEYS